mmetsp:Transcript_42600/g.110058  ORF Transcript_42600/g.110058 Transcript_42600/m.110058 type:complete len:235 (-) Transcript_42600:663-1367(-)
MLQLLLAVRLRRSLGLPLLLLRLRLPHPLAALLDPVTAMVPVAALLLRLRGLRVLGLNVVVPWRRCRHRLRLGLCLGLGLGMRRSRAAALRLLGANPARLREHKAAFLRCEPVLALSAALRVEEQQLAGEDVLGLRLRVRLLSMRRHRPFAGFRALGRRTGCGPRQAEGHISLEAFPLAELGHGRCGRRETHSGRVRHARRQPERPQDRRGRTRHRRLKGESPGGCVPSDRGLL